MSIFGSILSKIMHHGEASAAPAPSAPSASPTSTPSAAPTPTSTAQTGTAPGSTASSQSGAAPGTVSPTSAPAGTVDVGAVLDGLAAKNSQKLDWKHSIVDMMKLLDLDSSLTARKELAGELHYTGDTTDSAGMNMWLHKQVMQKLAANGGKVPDDLKV